MGRRDPRFIGPDVIRLFEENLDFNSKRFVITWFFSLIPVKEPKVDALGLLLDILGLIPVAGTVGKVFEIGLVTAQAAAELAELFGFELEEEDIELAKLRLEHQSLLDAFKELREEEGRLLRVVDQQRERISALLATQELLQDELATIEAVPAGITGLANSILIDIERMEQFIPRIQAGEVRGIIRGRTGQVKSKTLSIRGLASG